MRLICCGSSNCSRISCSPGFAARQPGLAARVSTANAPSIGNAESSEVISTCANRSKLSYPASRAADRSEMFIVRLRILRWLHFHALRSRSALRTFDVIDGLSEHLLYIAPRTNKAWAVVIVDLRYGCAFS